MNQTRTPVLTGGCQCGAVRYALYATPHNPHVCHCRMCQKAFGAAYAPLANVANADFAWTRGRPAVWKSSSVVERGFCAHCGTPLSFRYTDAARIGFSIGSLDDPAAVVPQKAFGTESKLPWADAVPGLPASTTKGDIPAERMEQLRSLQHPDHDTDRRGQG